MQKPDPLRLLACQVAIPDVVRAGDRNRHVASVCERISNSLAESGPVDLIVLPELCTMTYSREAFEMLDDLAEPLDGPSVTRFAELARAESAMLVFGMARRTDTGFRISQVILSETGKVVACYDKMHLCQYGASCEKEFFERGEKLASDYIKVLTTSTAMREKVFQVVENIRRQRPIVTKSSVNN